MDLNSFVSNIHWIPVIVLTIISFVIGFIWHSTLLFGKTWKLENNPNDLNIKFNVPLIFSVTAIMHFIAIMSMSAVISGRDGVNGFLIGFLISVVWILPAMTGTYLFANRSSKLLFIDAGMYASPKIYK